MHEETGFDAVPVDLGFSYSFPTPEEYRNLYSRGVAEITEHAFLVEVPEKPPVLSAEHDEWRWCTFPVGYNDDLDAQLREGRLGFTRLDAR